MLTQKQENFCLNILSGMSATDAALSAGYARMSPTHTTAMLKTAKIAVRLAELRKPREKAAISSYEERLQILTEIQRARFGQFVDKEGNLDIPDKEALDSAALQEVKTTKFRGGKGGRTSEITTTIKLRDPVRAIEEHNKMAGDYAPVRTDHTFDGDGLATILGKLRGVPQLEEVYDAEQEEGQSTEED